MTDQHEHGKPWHAGYDQGHYDRVNAYGHHYPRWMGLTGRAGYDAGWEAAADEPLCPNAQNEIDRGWRKPGQRQ